LRNGCSFQARKVYAIILEVKPWDSFGRKSALLPDVFEGDGFWRDARLRFGSGGVTLLRQGYGG
jgi:hypothetical protein